LRELTFNGFLSQYVRVLSRDDTLKLYKLAAEAAEVNPRLREPLLLYALSVNKTAVLLRATKHPQLHEEYVRVLLRLASNTERAGLNPESCSHMLPERYRKVYRSYLSVRDRKEHDKHTKSLLYQRIKKIQVKKQVSNYRVYKDLQLNPGNVNAFLKHGDVSKVSLTTARRMLEYLELK
jgi:hypothetical protein